MFVIFVLAFGFTGASVSAAHDLYWTERVGDPAVTVIMGSDIDGENVTVVRELPEMASFAVDVEVTDDHIYWTGHNGRDLWRANRDGSEAIRLIDNHSGFTSLHFMVIDESEESIYLTDHGNGIFRTDLDGGNITNLRSPPPINFTGLARREGSEWIWLSSANNFLYYQTLPSSAQPNIRELAGGNDTYGLVYDADTDTVYYTVFAGGAPGAGSLRSYNFASDVDTLLREGLTGPLGLKFSPSGTHLLIAERDRGVSAYQIDNHGYELLVEATDAHFGVAVNADPADLPDGPPPTPPAEDGDTIFLADFQEEEAGQQPRTLADGGVWSGMTSEPAEGTVTVVQDEDNLFGFGTDNRFLRYESVRGFTMSRTLPGVEVATLSFDYIGRVREIDSNRWLNANLQVGGARASTNSLRMVGASIRTHPPDGVDHAGNPVWPTPQGYDGPINPSYGANDVPLRFSFITNNSDETITFSAPDGEEYDLSPEHTAVWVYDYNTETWSNPLPEYQFAREAGAVGGLINNLVFQLDTNAPLRSFDLDNIQVIMGAHIPEPATRRFPAGDFLLELAWELGPDDRDYLTDDNRQRGLAYNPVTGHLIVPDREETIAVIDASDGAHVGTLSNTGIEGGNFPLNHVVVTDDGIIYGANLTTDTLGDPGPLKVYRWDNEQADPVVVYEGDPSRDGDEPALRRFGDTMAVRGTGVDTQILMGDRFRTTATILTPTDESLNTFVDNLLVTDAPNAAFRHGLVFGEGNTFYGKRQPQVGSTGATPALVQVEFDLEEGTGTVIRSFESTVFPADIGPIAVDLERGLLVGLDSYAHEGMNARQPDVFLYDFFILSEETFNAPMDSDSFGPGNLNGNGAGQVVFGNNGMVFVLDTNNGIAAFNVVEFVDALTFTSWMDGLSPEDRPPEGQRGPMDQPAGDGIPNAMKYALGLSPMAPGTANLAFQQIERLDVNGTEADYLTLTFTRPNAVSDVGYHVDASGDPDGWPDAAVLVDSVDNGDGTTTYTYRDIQSIGEAHRRFLRLRILLETE